MEKLVFHNLYVQTEYNFLSSTVSIKNLKNELYRYASSSIAIADEAMHGVYKFYKACIEANCKPIIGLKAKIYNENIDNFIILYAKDNNGYKNLMRISSEIQINKKNVNLEYLKNNSKGVIACIPFFENELKYYYDNHNMTYFEEVINNYKDSFEELYFGLTLQVSNYNIRELMNLSMNYDILPVALHRVNMIKPEHLESYKILRCISKGIQNYETSELEENSYFESSEELLNNYINYQELVYNQNKISEACNVSIEFEGYKFPRVDVENSDTKTYLANLCKAGLNKRLEQNRKIYNKNYSGKIELYRDRLLHELDVIDRMGFNDYFLVVYDYVKYAKTHDILVGPGRGSAGGSLVSYSLGITDMDPIEYGLLFERFLNIERISMPDIDVDFEDDRRDEVMKYLGEKYGQMRVAHITTFGSLKPRMVIKDIARVKNTSTNKLNEIMKYIPQSYSDLNLNKIIDNSPILQRMIESDEEVKYIIDNALIIEDFPRNTSTHACGMIMAPSDLRDYTPLSNGLDGLYQTQYEASDLEEIGLVKMDILGLRTLTITKNIISLVKRNNPDFDYNRIPFDDKNVYDMLARGETTGVFQLEANGVRKVLGNIRTSCFEDIVSATSLYRPGPMDNIPTYANRKTGKEQITYMDPTIEDVLKNTYGVIVYQEQIMLIANVFAGYSLGEADVLRRAISKKKISVMEQEKTKFINKATSIGRNPQTAKKMFDYIEKFASYGFNRSHAVAYSIIAYKMAYMKYYFNEAYMCSILNNVIGNTEKTVDYITECKKNGIRIYAPSINKSEPGYIYNNKAILYPLMGISGVGDSIVRRIMDERDDRAFDSYDDFVKRMKGAIDKKTTCSLIYAGCFDEFKETRKSMVESFDEVNNRSDYIDLFGSNVLKRNKTNEEFGFEEISFLEKGALGFNLKYDLFIKYLPLKEKYHTIDLSKLKEGVLSKVFFVAKNFKTIKTKNGDDMAFLVACDSDCNYDAVIFPKSYEMIKDEVDGIDGKAIIALAKLETKENNGSIRTSLIIDKIKIMNN